MKVNYLEIYDPNRVRIGILDAYTSIIWKTEYYGAGQFEIYAPLNDENLKNLAIGNFVARTGDPVVGLIEAYETTWTPQEGRMLIVTGRMAKCLLDRRIIMRLSGEGTALRNYPTELTGDVEQACRTLFSNNIISSMHTARNIPFLKLGYTSGKTHAIVDDSGNPASKQVTWDNLLEYTDSLLEEYQMGSLIRLADDKNLYIDTYEGVDLSVDNPNNIQPIIFSQKFDNLLSSDWLVNLQTQKNVAIIAGEGEGAERMCQAINHTVVAGIGRKEMYVDASSLSKTYKNDGDEEEKTYADAVYASMLRCQGKQELSALTYGERVLKGSTDLTNSTLSFGLNADYYVGDRVTFADDDLDLYSNVRILSATEVQDENGYSIDVEFGG